MKRLLAVFVSMLASTSAFAQPPPGKGCRVQVDGEWIPMLSSSSLSSCLKYVEAASIPDQRQLAAFGPTALAYESGRFFRSADDGQTWQAIALQEDNDTALNRLASAPAKNRGGQNSRTNTQMVAAVTAASTEPALAPVSDVAPAPVQQLAQAAIVPAADVKTPRAVQVSNLNASYGCQLRMPDRWETKPTTSLSDCGRLLKASSARTGTSTGQAYWFGNYLFYASRQLYQSTNGKDWRLLQ